MRTQVSLTAADARAILDAACAEATRRALEVTVAVVDGAGVLLALARLDGARLHTPDATTLKARTAAIVRTPTAELQGAVAAYPALLSFPGRMPLTGGMPLISAGTVVGGVGSSGGEPTDDEAVCSAAMRAMADLAAEPGDDHPGAHRDRR